MSPTPLYIFDLDGTLADCSHRLHYIQGEHKDWDAFHAACVDDQPIWPLIKVLRSLRKSGEVWLWTGRSRAVIRETLEWLEYHDALPWRFRALAASESIRMRPSDDHRHDDVLKAEWLSEVEPPEYDRLLLGGVFEDRKRVVEMWRRHGITCCQVAPGEF